MAKLKTHIGISVYDDDTVTIKRSEFDDKGANTGETEIQPRDVAEALNLKTSNDELADYVDEVVGNENGSDPPEDDTDTTQPTKSAKTPKRRKGAK